MRAFIHEWSGVLMLVGGLSGAGFFLLAYMLKARFGTPPSWENERRVFALQCVGAALIVLAALVWISGVISGIRIYR